MIIGTKLTGERGRGWFTTIFRLRIRYFRLCWFDLDKLTRNDLLIFKFISDILPALRHFIQGELVLVKSIYYLFVRCSRQFLHQNWLSHSFSTMDTRQCWNVLSLNWVYWVLAPARRVVSWDTVVILPDGQGMENRTFWMWFYMNLTKTERFMTKYVFDLFMT